MRRARAILLLAALLGGGVACSGAAAGSLAADGGATPLVDAGGCGAACVPPDGGGECLVQGQECNDAGIGGQCCLGLACTSNLCQLDPSPCPNGGLLLPSGCGCDPTLGSSAGCAPGLVCDADLQCVPDAGVPILLVGQPIGAACDPLASYPDGGPAPPCAQPDGGGSVDCVPDPSGVFLYACAQACAGNADCPLAWQACNSPFAAPGHCGDALCTGFPATPSEEAKGFFAACPDGGGLCLPFSVVVSSGSGPAQVASYGLCLQASDAGPNSSCADPPSRGGPLCDPAQLCVLGRCRNPCNAALGATPDAGCLASEVCAPLGVQAPAPGALYAAGGCVSPCELPGGSCDAGVDAGAKEAVDGGGPAGRDGG